MCIHNDSITDYNFWSGQRQVLISEFFGPISDILMKIITGSIMLLIVGWMIVIRCFMWCYFKFILYLFKNTIIILPHSYRFFPIIFETKQFKAHQKWCKQKNRTQNEKKKKIRKHHPEPQNQQLKPSSPARVAAAANKRLSLVAGIRFFPTVSELCVKALENILLPNKSSKQANLRGPLG